MDTQLKELALTALGNRMKLRDYCTKRKKVGSEENERKGNLQKAASTYWSKLTVKVKALNSRRYGYDKKSADAL